MLFSNILAAGLLGFASTTFAAPQPVRRAGDLGHHVKAPQPYGPHGWPPHASGTATGILPTGTAFLPTGTGVPFPIPTGTWPCPVDGAVVCNGPGHFGLCDFGHAKSERVAPGTACHRGEIIAADSHDAPAPTGSYYKS